ncbi:MAG: C39 family peptidase [Microcoleaceae cyanobacterium]
MKLADFIGTETKYDVDQISNDIELSRQIQTRLIALGLLDPPADGIFGQKSTAALHQFQKYMKCEEPGYLGTETARKLIETKPEDIPKPSLILKATKSTIFKFTPLASSQLQDWEKFSIEGGKTFEILTYDPIRGHLRVAFRKDTFGGRSMVYVWSEHAEVRFRDQVVYPKPLPKSHRISGISYKSQIDNWYNPTGACNVTSLAMCLEYLGASRRTGYTQFEDELYEYALSQGYSRHNPYDLARVVKDYGMQDFFTENTMIEDIQDWVAANNPAVIHGYFTSFGHIIVVVGYDEQGFIVHDPYGEWFPSGYRTDLSGAYLHYSYSLIKRVCIPDGKFWVHFISK